MPRLGLLAAVLVGAASAGSPVFAVREILDAGGRKTPLSGWIADEVAARLMTDSGWVAVERSRIQALAEEHALAGAGATGPGVSAGALLGAQRHVFGVYHVAGDGYLVSLRVVDANSGAILGFPKIALERNPALDSLLAKDRRPGRMLADGPLVLDRCTWQGQVMIQCVGVLDASFDGRLDIPDDQDPQLLGDGSRVRFSYFTVDGATNDGRQLVRARSRARVALYFPSSGRPDSFQELRLRYRYGGHDHRLEGAVPIE